MTDYNVIERRAEVVEGKVIKPWPVYFLLKKRKQQEQLHYIRLEIFQVP